MRIYDIVREQPGIHFRALARAANLSSVGQLRHHVDRLTRRGVVAEVGDGGYKRYFLVGDHDPRLRPSLALFSRRVPRRIATLLLVRAMTRTELRRSLGCADSTLGFHLSRMVQLSVVGKRRDRSGCRYELLSPDLVRQALSIRARRPAFAAPAPVVRVEPPLRVGTAYGAFAPHAPALSQDGRGEASA